MQTRSPHTFYDVIVAGAGPVGLFLACELRLAKCSVLVLEKTENSNLTLKKAPFGIRGLSSLSVEHLDRRGLLNDLEIHKRLKSPHQNSGQGARRQGGHFAGIPFLDGNIDTSQWKYRLPSSTETSLISEMAELEEVLSRRAESLGVEIKRGIAVTGFHQSENEVIVKSAQQSFTAHWLVGCDGARSAIRKLGDFDFAGTEPEFTGYSTLVDVADPSILKSGRHVTQSGMYMQSQPGYILMQDFDKGAFHASDKPITLEHLQSVLRRISNTEITITALRAATTWTDRARQATSYRKGRVLLAGDAAHIHSPLGGQGLNLGLGDAMNLGWKLAATIHNKAPEGLLDSYQTERKPIGERVLDWSRAQVAVMMPTPQGRALNSIFHDLMGTRDGATYFAGKVWGISTRFNLNSDNPIVGQSTPNFEFEDGRTVGELMRGGRGILLDFNRSEPLENLAAEFFEQIVYVPGPAKNNLGLSAVLVRPDGIVVWASNAEVDESAFVRTATKWFGTYAPDQNK